MYGDGGRSSNVETAPLYPPSSPHPLILESSRAARAFGEKSPPSLCLCVSVVISSGPAYGLQTGLNCFAGRQSPSSHALAAAWQALAPASAFLSRRAIIA